MRPQLSGIRRSALSAQRHLLRLPKVGRRLSRPLVDRSPYRIYAARGGTGSSQTARVLRRSGRAFVRPDVAWMPPYADPAGSLLAANLAELHPAAEPSEVLMPSTDYDVTVSNYDVFSERCHGRYAADPQRTIEQNLVGLCDWVRANDHFVVLNNSSIQSLFSRNDIRSVVFLVRHPIDSLISWAKPERHGDTLELLGGQSSEAAVDYWGLRWNQHVDEYFRCVEADLQPVLIRYEFAYEDATHAPGLAPVFAEMNPSTRPTYERAMGARLRELVADNYDKLYPRWDI